jgi:hypothetical protein
MSLVWNSVLPARTARFDVGRKGNHMILSQPFNLWPGTNMDNPPSGLVPSLENGRVTRNKCPLNPGLDWLLI